MAEVENNENREPVPFSSLVGGGAAGAVITTAAAGGVGMYQTRGGKEALDKHVTKRNELQKLYDEHKLHAETHFETGHPEIAERKAADTKLPIDQPKIDKFDGYDALKPKAHEYLGDHAISLDLAAHDGGVHADKTYAQIQAEINKIADPAKKGLAQTALDTHAALEVEKLHKATVPAGATKPASIQEYGTKLNAWETAKDAEKLKHVNTRTSHYEKHLEEAKRVAQNAEKIQGKGVVSRFGHSIGQFARGNPFITGAILLGSTVVGIGAVDRVLNSGKSSDGYANQVTENRQAPAGGRGTP